MARYVTQVANTIVAVFGYAVDTVVVVLREAALENSLCPQAILSSRAIAILRAKKRAAGSMHMDSSRHQAWRWSAGRAAARAHRS